MEQGAATTTTRQAHYHVPQPMPWPIMGAFALFCMALGSVFVFNASSGGWVGVALGFMVLLYMMFRWFGDVIRESEAGKYGAWEDLSFRWGMSWFIFSEVMFFAGFFGALFWARVISVPDLASLDHNAYLWPGFTSHWPSAGPGFEEVFSPMGAWGLPALNTVLLLSSGADPLVADHEHAILGIRRQRKSGLPRPRQQRAEQAHPQSAPGDFNLSEIHRQVAAPGASVKVVDLVCDKAGLRLSRTVPEFES